MKNIKHYLDILDRHRDEMAMAFMSDPGLSKTSQCKEWCEEHGRNYFEFITSQRMPSEISGMAMPDNDEKRMKIYDFDYLLDMKDGDMLAFDEFTNGNIMTLNACLTLIQERSMLSGHKLPSILVVAMGNHQGQCDLLPQTKQRFVWIDVKFDRVTWKNWVKENLECTPTDKLLNCIEEQYSSTFSQNRYNYLTARSVTNLLKLAKDIDKSDPIWKMMPNLSPLIVDELYRSTKISGFAKQKIEMIEAAKNIMVGNFTEGASIKRVMIAEIRDATSTKDLKKIIEDAEAGVFKDVGAEFIEAIKNIDPRDPWEKHRDELVSKIETIRVGANRNELKNSSDAALIQLSAIESQQELDDLVHKITTGVFGSLLKEALFDEWDNI